MPERESCRERVTFHRDGTDLLQSVGASSQFAVSKEDMEPSPLQAFVVALLDVGDRLVGLVDNLIEGVAEATGRTQDEATTEVLGMLFGTAMVRMDSIPDDDFKLATKLLRRTFTAVMADVEQAAELARQREFRSHATSSHGRPV